MQKTRTIDKSTKWRFGATAALLLLCPLLQALFSRFGTSLFPVYRLFSKSLIRIQAAVVSLVPFALWDIAALLGTLALGATFVWFAFHKRQLLVWLSHVCCVLAALLFLFVGGWALNHYAPPLADELDLTVEQYTTDELAEATAWYLQQAADLAVAVPREQDGNLQKQDFFELAKIAGASYEPLESQFPIFKGSQAPVKALLVAGEPLLYSGHVGIFFSPTGESSVPLNCAPAETPYTMCHEAAHRLGIASEQEANFAAYVACAQSNDVRFAYAGAYNAFGYCYNALVANNPERAKAMLEDAVETDAALGVQLVFLDRSATRSHYEPYEGKAKEVGTSVNDSYLKTFGEDAGIKSYGLVVDYLIAWHEQNE